MTLPYFLPLLLLFDYRRFTALIVPTTLDGNTSKLLRIARNIKRVREMTIREGLKYAVTVLFVSFLIR